MMLALLKSMWYLFVQTGSAQVFKAFGFTFCLGGSPLEEIALARSAAVYGLCRGHLGFGALGLGFWEVESGAR